MRYYPQTDEAKAVLSSHYETFLGVQEVSPIQQRSLGYRVSSPVHHRTRKATQVSFGWGCQATTQNQVEPLSVSLPLPYGTHGWLSTFWCRGKRFILMDTKFVQTSADAYELPTSRDVKQQSAIILYLLVNSLLKIYFSSHIGKTLQDLANWL